MASKALLTCIEQIVAIGRNYALHIKELNNAAPKEPFFFLKPTTSYVPSGGKVEIPKGVIVHHEGMRYICGPPYLERSSPVFVVQWNSASSSAEGVATSHSLQRTLTLQDMVGGHITALLACLTHESLALGIDMTARNMQDVVKKAGLPWSAVKGFDTFTPIR